MLMIRNKKYEIFMKYNWMACKRIVTNTTSCNGSTHKNHDATTISTNLPVKIIYCSVMRNT